MIGGPFFNKQLQQLEQLLTPYQKSICDADVIRDRQRKRYGNPNLTLAQMGFDQLAEIGKNFFTQLKQGKLKILKIAGTSMDNIKIIVQNPSKNIIKTSIQAGQMFGPYNDTSNAQNLMCTRNINMDLKIGQNQFNVPTMCYNRQRSIPCGQEFIIANFKSIQYKIGMNQKQVWEITFDTNSDKIKKVNQIPLQQDLLQFTINEWFEKRKAQRNERNG